MLEPGSLPLAVLEPVGQGVDLAGRGNGRHLPRLRVLHLPQVDRERLALEVQCVPRRLQLADGVGALDDFRSEHVAGDLRQDGGVSRGDREPQAIRADRISSRSSSIVSRV